MFIHVSIKAFLWGDFFNYVKNMCLANSVMEFSVF